VGGTASVEFNPDPPGGCVKTGYVAYRAAPGEVNQLKLSFGVADVVPGVLDCFENRLEVAAAFSDTAGVTAGHLCHSARPTAAVCLSDDAVAWPRIYLGDGNDTLRLTAPAFVDWPVAAGTFGASVDAGPGNDDLNTVNGAADYVDCGDGVDTITADFDDQLVNCENVTLTPA
jgi:hypothetical protein